MEAGFVPVCGEDDEFYAQTRKHICQLFGKDESDCEVFFVSSGMVAHVLTMTSVGQSLDGIQCHSLFRGELDPVKLRGNYFQYDRICVGGYWWDH